LLQVFAIELVTFAVDFVPLAVEFGDFAVEFVGFALEFVTLALQFVALAIELDAFIRHGYNDSKKLTIFHKVNDFRHGRCHLKASEASSTCRLAS